MIVTCEQCHARYLVASLKLGTTGRTVRCGVCSHTWYQPPGEEKSAEAPASFQDYMEPIPEGVRPIPEGSAMPSLKEPKKKFIAKSDAAKETVTGAVAAAAVFLLILSGLVMFHKPIIRLWPPSAGLFSMIGIDDPLPGEGLVIDQVAAKGAKGVDGKYKLTVTGKIINTLKSAAEVPALEVDVGNSKLRLPLDKKTLAGNSEFAFTATYDHVAEDIKDVTVGFATE